MMNVSLILAVATWEETVSVCVPQSLTLLRLVTRSASTLAGGRLDFVQSCAKVVQYTSLVAHLANKRAKTLAMNVRITVTMYIVWKVATVQMDTSVMVSSVYQP
jgi:hypothetical protein